MTHSPAREAVKAAFLRLLEERPLREITVKDIVQSCGVNRNTFYYHFRETAARFALERRQAVLHINQSAHRDLFELCLMDVCRRVVEDYAAAAIGSVPIPPEDRAVIIRFYQCECFGQVMAWLNDGMRYDIGKQFRRLCYLGEGMTERMLKRAMETDT